MPCRNFCLKDGASMKDIDYLIIGAGLSGSVIARELTDKGYKCVILEEHMDDTIKSALKVVRELCEKQ